MMPDPHEEGLAFLAGINERIDSQDRAARRSGRSWRSRRDVTGTPGWQRQQEEAEERIAETGDRLFSQRLLLDRIAESGEDPK